MRVPFPHVAALPRSPLRDEGLPSAAAARKGHAPSVRVPFPHAAALPRSPLRDEGLPSAPPRESLRSGKTLAPALGGGDGIREVPVTARYLSPVPVPGTCPQPVGSSPWRRTRSRPSPPRRPAARRGARRPPSRGATSAATVSTSAAGTSSTSSSWTVSSRRAARVLGAQAAVDRDHRELEEVRRGALDAGVDRDPAAVVAHGEVGARELRQVAHAAVEGLDPAVALGRGEGLAACSPGRRRSGRSRRP